jgi:hypothetical protein
MISICSAESGGGPYRCDGPWCAFSQEGEWNRNNFFDLRLIFYRRYP